MRKNEPTAANRVAGPIPFYDANGQLKKNLTFDNGSNEVYTYRSSTNDWVAANADTTELGGANTSGMYLLQLSQAETNYDSIVGVKLVKAGYEDQFWFERIDNTPDVNVASIADDAITAAALATDSITADALATDAITEIVAAIFAFATETGMTFVGVCRGMAALAFGEETDDEAEDTVTPILFKSIDGLKTRISAVWAAGVKTVTKDIT